MTIVYQSNVCFSAVLLHFLVDVAFNRRWDSVTMRRYLRVLSPVDFYLCTPHRSLTSQRGQSYTRLLVLDEDPTVGEFVHVYKASKYLYLLQVRIFFISLRHFARRAKCLYGFGNVLSFFFLFSRQNLVKTIT